MDRTRILVRQAIKPAIVSVVCAWIVGCSPKMDWREIRMDAINATALFPAKPVEVSRSLQLPENPKAFTLTLRSARIDDAVFAVGWVIDSNSSTRGLLEAAMLANIEAIPESIRRQTITQGAQQMYEVHATGRIRSGPNAEPVPAQLWMRTLTVADALNPGLAGSSPQGKLLKTIEIIAAGPTSQLTENDARQFIESLKLAR